MATRKQLHRKIYNTITNTFQYAVFKYMYICDNMKENEGGETFVLTTHKNTLHHDDFSEFLNNK